MLKPQPTASDGITGGREIEGTKASLGHANTKQPEIAQGEQREGG